MKRIKKVARKYAGLSSCKNCPFFNKCNLDRITVCINEKVKAFIRGANWANKQNSLKNKYETDKSES
jgi:hypothetical protein